MKPWLKALLTITAPVILIAVGLLWPIEETSGVDAFRPVGITGDLSALGEVGPAAELSDAISALHPSANSLEDIRSGRYKYREDDLPWTFSVPIDWGKPPNELATRRVLQRFAMADPFLASYAETGSVEDFRQAAFFMLDWQTYYQTGQKLTEHSWDEDAVLARAERLAYVLSRIEHEPSLLNEDGTRSLISLADFHIQRASDSVYGTSPDTILDTSEFQKLCQVLDGLPACQS